MKAAKIDALPLALGGMTAMAAAIGIGRFIYTPILPPMVEALGLSKSAAGLIASANFVGYLLGALGATLPWGKAKPRRALLLFLVLSGVTTAGMALASQTPLLMLLRFVGGIASAYVLVLSSALVLQRLSAAGAPQLSSIHFAGVGIGIVVSALLTWGLAAAGSDWRAMWLWSGLVSVANVGLVAWLVPEGTSEPRASTDSGAAAAEKSNRSAVRRLSLAYGLFGFGYIITTTFIVAIVRASAEARPLEPLFWLVIGVVATPSVWAWVKVGRRLGTPTAFALACLSLAVGVVASVLSPAIWALAAASCLLGATFMGVTSLGLIGVREFAPAEADRWIAIATSAFGTGQIAGPVAAGYGYDMTGSFVLPSLIAAAALVVAALLAFSLANRHAMPAA